MRVNSVDKNGKGSYSVGRDRYGRLIGLDQHERQFFVQEAAFEEFLKKQKGS
jgi:hypothetical protein